MYKEGHITEFPIIGVNVKNKMSDRRQCLESLMTKATYNKKIIELTIFLVYFELKKINAN